MIYLLIVSLIWAFSFGLIKDNLAGVNSNFVAFSRLLLSFLVFLPFIRLKNLPKKAAFRLLFIGMVQYGLMYITYIYSFKFLKAYEVALFTILTPLYVTLISQIKIKRHFWINLATTSLAVLGAAVVETVHLSNQNLINGFLILQISNFCFAFGQIEYKDVMNQLPDIKDKNIFGILYLGAALITAITTIVFTDLSSIQLNPRQVLSILYLGIVASGIAFFLWNFGARRVNSGALAIFNDLKIPLAVAVSLLVFKESADLPALILGGGIILSALIINEWSIRRQKPKQSINKKQSSLLE